MTWWGIIHGEARAVMETVEENSLDGLMCDPPYGLGNRQPDAADLIAYLQGAELDTGGDFMGKDWNIPSVAFWRAAYRAMKPGAHLLCYAGARTQTLVALGIFAAGFEVRDTLWWQYAKGFPKSHNISKALDRMAGAERPVVGHQTLTGNAAVSLKDKGGTYGVQVGTVEAKVIDITGPATPLAKLFDGYGTALKPAYEPIILARKPLDGTIVENVTRWGVGGIDVDGCRIEGGTPALKWERPRDMGFLGGTDSGPCAALASDKGRWPANLILDEGAAALLDAVVGERKSGKSVTRNGGGNKIFKGKGPGARVDGGYTDSGAPSRFYEIAGFGDDEIDDLRFYFSAKVSTKEREAGTEHLHRYTREEMTGRKDGAAALDSPRTGAGRGDEEGSTNPHGTLKPWRLNRYLARLILPPPHVDGSLRRIAIPFAGVGSEMIGALAAGWDCVMGIERGDPIVDYLAIGNARVAHYEALRLGGKISPAPPRRIFTPLPAEPPRQVTMFGT